MWIREVEPFFRLSPLQMIGLVAYGEARGEGRVGMQAVINTIQNRRIHPLRRFASSSILTATRSPYHAIILKRWQFSCFNLGDPNRAILLNLSDPIAFERAIMNNTALRTAVDLCEALRLGRLADITGAADHFFTIHIPNPRWTLGMTYRTTIGRHEFWSEEPHYYQSPQTYRPEQEYVFTETRTPEVLPVAGLVTIAGILGGI